MAEGRCKKAEYDSCGPIKDGDDYCLFHKPDKSNEEAGEFYERLKGQAIEQADKDGKSRLVFKNEVNWKGYVFPWDERTTFSNAIFESWANFSYATFKSEAYFKKATFIRGVNFKTAIFKNLANFSGSIFIGSSITDEGGRGRGGSREQLPARIHALP